MLGRLTGGAVILQMDTLKINAKSFPTFWISLAQGFILAIIKVINGSVYFWRKDGKSPMV